MRKAIYLIIPFFLIFGCTSTKKTNSNYLSEAPEWVRQSPNSPAYYHGVGSATKANTRMDFHEKARENALSDLAGNISVKITSTSVLNQYEINNQYSEYFKDNIKLSSEEYLEGYELVDSWENEEQYWIYYRLSKQKYEEVKTQRKDAAISKSRGSFEQAAEFKQSGNLKESIRFNIRALEDIKDFLGEEILVDIDGTEQAYGSSLVSELTKTIQEIRIVYPEESLAVKRGKTPETNPLTVKVVDGNERMLSGININSFISWNPGRKIISESDSKGEARIEVDKADTRKTEEFIESFVDMDGLTRESTGDPVIRKLLQSMSTPDFVLPVHIVSPSFFIELRESNLGKPLEKSLLSQDIVVLLLKDGFPIDSRPDIADLILTITAITKTNSQRNGMFSTTMKVNILITDNFGQVVYEETIDDLSGLSDSFEAAGLDAYEALSNRYKINIYPDIYNKLFK